MESYISRYNRAQNRARNGGDGSASNQSEILFERVNMRLELEGCSARTKSQGFLASCFSIHKTSALGRLIDLLSPGLATSILYDVQVDYDDMNGTGIQGS